jgi:hypothetical protein
MELLPMTKSETREIAAEIPMVAKKMVMTHRRVLLASSFFTAFGSGFANLVSPKIKTDITGSAMTGASPPGRQSGMIKNGNRRDKSYGLGRVGFPPPEPDVADQAVPL